MAKRRSPQLQPPTMFGPTPDATPNPPAPTAPPVPMPRVSGPPAAVPLPDAPNPAAPRPRASAGPVDVQALIVAAIANGTHAPPDLTPERLEWLEPDVPASTAVVVARMMIRADVARPDPRADWTLADVLCLWAMEHFPEAAAGVCQDRPGNPWWFGECCAAIFRRRASLDWRFAAWAAERWPADVVKLASRIAIPGLDAAWVASIGLLEGVAPLAAGVGVAGRIEPQQERKAAA